MNHHQIKKLFSLLLVLIVLFCTSSPGYAASFRKRTATDNSFSFVLPADWSVKIATMTHIMAQSPRGEELYGSTMDIPENPTMQRLTPQRIPISPPLSPVAFVQRLVPIFHPEFRRLKIVHVTTLPNIASSGPLGPFQLQQAVIVYDFLKGNSPYRGIVLVTTPAPGTNTGLAQWPVSNQGIRAPIQVFKTHSKEYSKILLSMKPNMQVISRYYQNQGDFLQSYAAQQQALSNAILNYGRQDNP